MRPIDMIFPGHQSDIAAKRCNQQIGCGKEIEDFGKEFHDALSAKEYNISGLCQVCQDNFFNGPECA